MKKQHQNKKGDKKRNKVTLILVTLLTLIFVPLIIGTGVFMYFIKDTPELVYSKLEDTQSSNLFDVNNQFFMTIGVKKRETIPPNQIPPVLKDAILSIEDRRFEKHIGVDPIRITGAAISNLKGNHTQGGSTLTQQLIKLSYFSTKQEDQTYKRKAQEAWLSIKLEKNKSKDEILTYYINRVYMANGLYGMKTAAKDYYNKDFDKLNLSQYALLAGIPQAPNDYDPYVHPDNAKKRRDLVLKEMLENKKISDAQYNEAIAVPIDDGLVPLKNKNTDKQMIADNYINEVIKEVKERTKKDIYTDGLDIYTNIDMEAQTYLYNLVNNDSSAINFPDNKFQTAATLIDVKTGYVRAEIGGRKSEKPGQLELNRAVESKRDIGSTSKPLVAYGPLIEEANYGSGQIFVDEPYNYKSSNKPVYNYDKAYRGGLTMRESLVDSRNIPALKALDEAGTDKAKEFISNLGLKNDVYESTAISMQASTEQLAAAYTPFANGGVYYRPSYINKVVYADGTEEKFEPEGKRAMKESTAYIITDMLKDVINRGTGSPAGVPGLIQAGKTGTSNYSDDDVNKIKGFGSPDITFVGYTPKYSLAVWTGYDEYFQAIPVYNQQLAMDIYRNFMTYLYQSKNLEITDWKLPNNIIKIGNEVYIKGHTNQYTPQTYYYESSEEDFYTKPSSRAVDPPKSASSESVEEKEPEEQEPEESTPASSQPSNNNNNEATAPNDSGETPPKKE